MMMENNSFLPVVSLTKLEREIYGLDISNIQSYLQEVKDEKLEQDAVNFYGEVMSGLMTGEYINNQKDEENQMWLNLLNSLKSMSDNEADAV